MATYWGLSYGHHDAAAVVVSGNSIIYSKRYHRPFITERDVDVIIANCGAPDHIYLHENKLRDLWRKVKSRDWTRLADGFMRLPKWPTYGNHHLSHAAYGYYTSPFKDQPAFVIVADAVGELETLAVYHFNGKKIGKRFHLKYPDSIGLFYSYHTAATGLIPNAQERVAMEMARLGGNTQLSSVRDTIWFDRGVLQARVDLHRTPSKRVTDANLIQDTYATAQAVLGEYFKGLLSGLSIGSGDNVVFAGGVAYNTDLVDSIRPLVRQLYVPKYPGDAGSALGAVMQFTKESVINIGVLYD